MRRPLRAALALCAVLATSLLTGCSSPATDSSVVAVDPITWQAPLWQELLGGEGTHPFDDPRTLTRLNDPATSELSVTQAESAARAARAWLTAEVTGVGREDFAGYWPDGDGTIGGQLPPDAACTNLNVLAVNPQPLPTTHSGVRDWVKVLLGWSAQCLAVDRSGPQITFAYLRAEDTGWSVVRPARVPHPDVQDSSGSVPEWTLANLEDCSDPNVRTRLDIAAAWAVLCADARADSVTLTARSGWRSVEDQADLFAEAVELYGEQEARRRVATADGDTCASAHCAGSAIDVQATEQALNWLNAVVLCTDLAGTFTPAVDGQCLTDLHPVPRLTRYGFTAPLPHSPGHLEWSLPLSPVQDTACAADAGAPVGDVIDAIWRCRLLTAGYPADQIDDVLPRARALARCESGLVPDFQAFAGRFTDQPHPDTGQPYEAIGLFGLTSSWTQALLGAEAPWWEAEQGALAGVERFVDEWTYGRDPWRPFGCVSGDGIRPGGLFAPVS